MPTRPGYVWSGTEWIGIGQEAAVSPFKYQATEPSSPATGDIWIDSDDEVPGITSSLNYRWRRIATGGETSLSGQDANGLPLVYNPGYEQVYLNGVLQYRGSDYVATDGTTITGLTALVANDTIEVLSFVTAPIGDTYTQAAADAKFLTQVNAASTYAIKNAPAFFVSNENGSTISSGNKMTFNTVVTNVNSCWSSANNRFTAPVTGKYLFSYSILNANAAAFYVQFRKNGTAMAVGQYPRSYTSLQYSANTASGILDLNANDYIEIWIESGAAHNYHCFFSGNLVSQ
jgi:hypothetical protein